MSAWDFAPDGFEPEIPCEQGTPYWKAVRCGLVTASRCADVLAWLKKGGEKSERRNYRSQVVVEILTGVPTEQRITREMQWGIEQEPFARAAYELDRDVMVEIAGFVLHPDVARFGASPDGLVGSEGLVQIKCPNTSTHLAWMMAGVIPLEHAPQMLAEMACTGRLWNDFVSYDPRLPEHLQLFIRRMDRNETFIAQLETEVVRFNAEIEEMLEQLPQPIVAVLDQVPADEVVL